MMDKKMLVQYRVGVGVIIVVLGGVMLVATMAACSSGEAHNRDNPKVTPVQCDHCADLLVSVNKPFYAQGEPVTVTAMISVHNDIRLDTSDWCDTLSNYETTLVDEQGQDVPWTGVGGTGVGCRFYAEISRNHPFTESFQLNKYFVLSEPGTYTLTMKKYVGTWGSEESFALIAKPVVFTRKP